MRDFVQTARRFAWAASVISVQQSINLVQPSGGRRHAANAFSAMSEVAVSQLSRSSQRVFATVDQAQRGFIDVALAPLAPQTLTRGSLPDALGGFAIDAVNQVQGCVSRSCSQTVSREPNGWGPVTPRR